MSANPTLRVELQHLAHVRSGDKGNTATIGVHAYDPAFYPLLKAQLTVEALRAHYGNPDWRIRRYEVDAIGSLNFTAEGALGGGVSRSLSLDVYGKSLCARLLDCVLEVPPHLAERLVGWSANAGR